jgi:hypothetical protein
MRKKIIVLYILFLILGCKKKSPCDVVTCKERQTCDNGACKCDSNSYDMGNWCYPKASGSNLIFYNISNNCRCFDTSVLAIASEPRIESTINNPEQLAIDLTAIFPENEKWGSKRVSADYFKKPSGDSLYATYDYLWSVKCPINDGSQVLAPKVMGKFNRAKDTLTLKIKWFGFQTGLPVLVDSCTKIYARKVI